MLFELESEREAHIVVLVHHLRKRMRLSSKELEVRLLDPVISCPELLRKV